MREASITGFFTRLYDVEVGGKSHRVLPRDIQFHPVNDRPEHVDFQRVGSASRVRVEVPVKVENAEKSPGLKRGGVVNLVRHTIEVWAHPEKIPSKIVIDLGSLDIGDSVHIEAIQLPDGVKPTISRNFTVLALRAPSVQKEVEAAPTAVAAEGAAAAPAAGAAAPAAKAGDAKAAAPAAAAAKPAAKK
jgi:large subunit ribosomal protein L25